VDGILAIDVIEGGYTKELFLRFLREKLLPQMNQYPGPNSVLVLDSCTIHHDAEVAQLVEEHGCLLEYLPPNSPWLNPIEECIHDFKMWLKRNHDMVKQCAHIANVVVLGLSSILPETCQNHIRNSGYMFHEDFVQNNA